MPIVGADNNGFLKQQLTLKDFHGAATNPATIGGVGASWRSSSSRAGRCRSG